MAQLHRRSSRQVRGEAGRRATRRAFDSQTHGAGLRALLPQTDQANGARWQGGSSTFRRAAVGPL